MGMSKRSTNKRSPGRPVKNVVPKIQAPPQDIFKAMFRASRKKRDARLKEEAAKIPTTQD